MNANIELFMFENNPLTVKAATKSGMNGFVIDWENRQLFERKHNLEDESLPDTVEALRKVTSATDKPVWCRINQFGDWTKSEVEQAYGNHADLVLLPMVKHKAEVEKFLSLVDGRMQTAILIETVQACEAAVELAKLPFDKVYVGLFDLSLSRRKENIFEPLYDGTVEELRDVFNHKAFGVGGLTTIDSGEPVRCLTLMEQLIKVGCDFTFLRNSFKRDILNKSLNHEIYNIRRAWKRLTEFS